MAALELATVPKITYALGILIEFIPHFEVRVITGQVPKVELQFGAVHLYWLH